MKITSRFTVAVHTLLAIHRFEGKEKTTSEFIAKSVNVNPVVIRRILQMLKNAGLVEVKAGSGGAELIKDPATVTLYDVFKAVDSLDGELFHFHENPNSDCPVGKNVHKVLDEYLENAQKAMENELKKTTLSELFQKLSGIEFPGGKTSKNI